MTTFPVQFLWIKGELSTLEHLCLKSFLDHGHEVHLYHYEKVLNVPSGVTFKNGAAIIPAENIFLSQSPSGSSYACFADVFRLKLLAEKGGWWFDMDHVCLAPLPDYKTFCVASSWEGKWGQCAINSMIFSPLGDAHILALLNRCEEIIAAGDVEFGATGPFLLQNYIKEHDLQELMVPWTVFCPYPWRMVHQLAQKTVKEWAIDQLRRVKQRVVQLYKKEFNAPYIRTESLAIHWHNEIWKKSEIDKNATFHPFSKIERLKRKHGVTNRVD